MTHFSENCTPLTVVTYNIRDREEIGRLTADFNDVCLLILPTDDQTPLAALSQIIRTIGAGLGKNATFVTLGEPVSLVHTHQSIPALHYQLWISIKRATIKYHPENRALPNHHFGALVHTRYTGTLKHTATRIQYTYCPACDKTTKDYGGKKHTYNSYGTLISDIWRDAVGDLEGDLTNVIHRFADLFGLDMYQELRVLDCRHLWSAAKRITDKTDTPYLTQPALFINPQPPDQEGTLYQGDCLETLRHLPDNSIDFAFIDPPYNLGKNYNNYADDLSIQTYFDWCDEWIREVTRLLKPGRTLAILNIPLWAIRHFLFMETILELQNWVAWDALSFPVRKIMPAHYTILCFSKGQSRPLPGLTGENNGVNITNSANAFFPLAPLDEQYCLRTSCVRQRNALGLTDRGQLSDLWWDIHRLKHNSRRVDHPCQLPPQLLYRFIAIFTEPGEVVLDCFNGAGTTTLAAHQMGRRYIGIELSAKYHQIAQSRHEEIRQGLDPFRKVERPLTEKNSRVPRMSQQIYEVPKKTLQLEVRRVAQLLKKLPSRDEMIEHGRYPIRYYDDYFASWGEVCAAARHDGMSETKEQKNTNGTTLAPTPHQMGLFDRGSTDAKR